MIVLAVDPGRMKCGMAVVSCTEGVLYRNVAARTDTVSIIADLVTRYQPVNIVIGKGTGSGDLASELNDMCEECPIVLVDEKYTSLDARKRYFQENPPRGLLRLVPRGLLLPKVSVDDYAAVILAERFLRECDRVQP